MGFVLAWAFPPIISPRMTDHLFEYEINMFMIPPYNNLLFLQGNLILSNLGLAEKRVYHAALNGTSNLPGASRHQKDD